MYNELNIFPLLSRHPEVLDLSFPDQFPPITVNLLPDCHQIPIKLLPDCQQIATKFTPIFHHHRIVTNLPQVYHETASIVSLLRSSLEYAPILWSLQYNVHEDFKTCKINFVIIYILRWEIITST